MKLHSLLTRIGFDPDYVTSGDFALPGKQSITTFGGSDIHGDQSNAMFQHLVMSKHARMVIFAHDAFGHQIQTASLLFSWIQLCYNHIIPFAIF